KRSRGFTNKRGWDKNQAVSEPLKAPNLGLNGVFKGSVSRILREFPCKTVNCVGPTQNDPKMIITVVVVQIFRQINRPIVRKVEAHWFTLTRAAGSSRQHSKTRHRHAAKFYDLRFAG
ncbi:MAG: hypothetical protein SH820_12805, partial [Xanthomonadales bacterium]|nr:hypothetical protein [Xanthomonadales bacterium]